MAQIRHKKDMARGHVLNHQYAWRELFRLAGIADQRFAYQLAIAADRPKPIRAAALHSARKPFAKAPQAQKRLRVTFQPLSSTALAIFSFDCAHYLPLSVLVLRAYCWCAYSCWRLNEARSSAPSPIHLNDHHSIRPAIAHRSYERICDFKPAYNANPHEYTSRPFASISVFRGSIWLSVVR